MCQIAYLVNISRLLEKHISKQILPHTPTVKVAKTYKQASGKILHFLSGNRQASSIRIVSNSKGEETVQIKTNSRRWHGV